MKTIFLHIGIGKTGTTTIQKSLSENQELLLSHNLHYIKSCGGAAGVGHQSFAKSLITEMPTYMQPVKNHKDHLAKVAAEIRASDAQHFLLSSENFPLADPHKIKKYFKAIDESLCFKIILFVRSQDELAESEYNQIIKVRAEKRPFTDYIASEFKADFMALASHWESVFGFGSMVCRVFDANNTSVMSDFLQCLPIDHKLMSSDLCQDKRKDNASIGHAQVMIKRMLNILRPSTSESDHVELPSAIVDLLRTLDIVTVHMSSKQAKKMRKRYRRSNRQFNRRYCGVNSAELGGRRYNDKQRDEHYIKCRQLIDISGGAS